MGLIRSSYLAGQAAISIASALVPTRIKCNGVWYNYVGDETVTRPSRETWTFQKWQTLSGTIIYVYTYISHWSGKPGSKADSYTLAPGVAIYRMGDGATVPTVYFGSVQEIAYSALATADRMIAQGTSTEESASCGMDGIAQEIGYDEEMTVQEKLTAILEKVQ